MFASSSDVAAMTKNERSESFHLTYQIKNQSRNIRLEMVPKIAGTVLKIMVYGQGNVEAQRCLNQASPTHRLSLSLFSSKEPFRADGALPFAARILISKLSKQVKKNYFAYQPPKIQKFIKSWPKRSMICLLWLGAIKSHTFFES